MTGLLVVLIFFVISTVPALISAQDQTPYDFQVGDDSRRQITRWESPVGPATADDNWSAGDLVRFESTEVADEVRFQKQCFLSFNLLRIREKAMQTARAASQTGLGLGQSPFTNVVEAFDDGHMTAPMWYSAMREAYPADITSLFVSKPEVQVLFDMKPVLLSYLVPYIRLYKVFYTDEGTATGNSAPRSGMGLSDNDKEIEFVFDDITRSADVEQILLNRSGRAGGVGLNSFGWEFLGANPAEVENNIKARLSVFFNEMDEFERERASLENPAWRYRFSDLVVPEPMYQRPADSPNFRELRDAYNPDFFRIKVVAGWSVTPHDPSEMGNRLLPQQFVDSGKDWDDFVELIEETRKVMYLNLIAHDINFNDDGSMELNAEYQAYAEGIISERNSDILQVDNVVRRTTGNRGTQSTWAKQVEQNRQTIEGLQANMRLLSDVSTGQCSEAVTIDYLNPGRGEGHVLFSPAPTLSEDQRTTITGIRNQLVALSAEVALETDLLRNIDRANAHALILEKIQLSNRIYRVMIDRSGLGFGGRPGGDWTPNGTLAVLAAADGLEVDQLDPEVRNSAWALQDRGDDLDVEELTEENQELDPTMVRRMVGAARLDMMLPFELHDNMFLLVPEHVGGSMYDRLQNPTSHPQAMPSAALRAGQHFIEFGLLPEEELPAGTNQPTSFRRMRTRRRRRSANPNRSQLPTVDFTGQAAYSETHFQQGVEELRRFVLWNSTHTNLVVAEKREEGNKIGIDFIFLGDLIDAVLGDISGQSRFNNSGPMDMHDMRGFHDWLREKHVTLMLGTFLFNDPLEYRRGHPEHNRNIDPVPVCLADIPISIEMFTMWFLQEVVAKHREKMTLREFLTAVFDTLLVNSFGTECVFDPGGNFTLAQEGLRVVPEYYTVPRDILTSIAGINIPAGRAGSLNNVYRHVRENLQNEGASMIDHIPSLSYSDYENVILFQAKGNDAHGELFETDLGTGLGAYLQVAERDLGNGVYHLNLGSDKGLVKTISFNRVDQTYLVESRIEQAGELGSFNQLRERYNAVVSLYGNMLFYPGQYIFINPSMVGDNIIQSTESLTTRLGIGGYFLITKVENIIEVGNFETILECSWVYSGFPTPSRNGPDCRGADQHGRFSNSGPIRRLDIEDLYQGRVTQAGETPGWEP